jgi:hypothetical protein
VNTKEIITIIIPNVIYNADCVVWFLLFDKNIAAIYTVVIPINAKKQPIYADLLNDFFKNILVKKAVVIITPPFEICQTELGISVRLK